MDQKFVQILWIQWSVKVNTMERESINKLFQLSRNKIYTDI